MIRFTKNFFLMNKFKVRPLCCNLPKCTPSRHDRETQSGSLRGREAAKEDGRICRRSGST